jgi:MFS family permease
MLCGLAPSLPFLISCRVIQGVGGAMLVPVGRSILVRSVPKGELVKALTLLGMPMMIGPIIGPALGGFITEVSSWRWIFWLNIPVGMVGFFLVSRFIEPVPPEPPRPFDKRGFILSGLGLASTLFGVDATSTESTSPAFGLAILALGIVMLALYGIHATRVEHPILDLRLLRLPTLRASVLGGSLFRCGISALPFLMPLMLQLGFGYSPVQSGFVTMCSTLGAFGSRGFTARILKRFGFRSVVSTVVTISSLSLATCALFTAATPAPVIMATLAFGGIFRAVGFSSVSALSFADIDPAHAGQATSIAFMSQRLAQVVAVAISAFSLHVLSDAEHHIPVFAFHLTFLLIASIGIVGALSFLRLDRNAGADLSGRKVA